MAEADRIESLTARRAVAYCLVVLSLLLGTQRATAETRFSTWNNTTGNWNAANWDFSPVSGTSQLLTFGGAGGYTATNDFAGTFALGQIFLTGTGGTSNLAGNQLQLGGEATINQFGAGNFNIGNNVELNGNATFGGFGSGVVTFNGVISETGGARNIVIERGNYVFTNTNNYSGTTTVNGGTLTLQTSGALGAGAVTLTTALGGIPMLQLQGGGVTIANSLSLLGAGVDGRGSLRNISGNNAWTGVITLGAGNSTIGSDAGTFTIGTAGGTAVSQGTRALTFLGAGNFVIDGNLLGTTATVSKFGPGSLTLNGTSTLTTGAKTIRNGQVIVQNLNPLGGGTITADRFRLTQSPVLTLAGVNGALGNVLTLGPGATLRIDNTTAYAGASGFERIADATALGLNGTLVEMLGNAAASTSETVGAATFDGLSRINIVSSGQQTTLTVASLARTNRGTLAITGTAGLLGTTERLISTAPPTVTAGLNADTLGSMTAPFFVNGTDHTFVTHGAGGFVNVAFSTNTLETPSTATDIINTAGIAITANRDAFAVRATGAITGAGQQLTVASGGLISNLATAATHDVNLRFGATGTAEALLYAAGAGKSTISGTLTTTGGLTKFGAGVLELSGNNAATLSGGVFVNDGTLQVGNANALGLNTGALNINGGTLDLQGNAVTMGTVTIGGFGSLIDTLGTGSITGTSFDVQSGTVSANLTGVGINLTKSTTGQAVIDTATSFTGTTTVSAGSLNLRHANALAGTSGVTVSAGAVELQNNIILAGKTLSITGAGNNDDGDGNGGALRNFSGDNSWTGDISLAASSTIGSDSNTLTLTNVLVNGFTLTLAGAGNGVINGISAAATGTLTKTGSGTWTINNDFNGATGTGSLATVSAGTLRITVPNFLPDVGGYNVSGQTAVLDMMSNSDTAVDLTVQNGGILQQSGGTITSGDDISIATGGMVIGSGSLISNDDFVLSTGGRVMGTGTLSVSGSGDHFNLRDGVIQKQIAAGSTGALFTKMTTGTVTFLNADSVMNLTGGLTVSQGTLSVQNRASLGVSAINFRPLFLSDTTNIGGATDDNDVVVTAVVVAEGTLGSFVNSANTANANSSFNLLKNSTLRLDNTTLYTGPSPSGRWFDNGALTLNSGTLELLGNATAASSETMGTLTYDRGGAVKVSRAVPGMTTTLTAASIARTGRGTLALQTTAGQLGADERIFSTAAPALDAGGIVAPSIFNDTDASFVTYGANGFANATVTSTNLATSLATDVVDAGPSALTANADANAVRLVGGVTYGHGSNTVTITSGGLSSNVAAITVHNVNFRFGATGVAEGVLIAGNTGASVFAGTLVTNAGLVKAGSGTVAINADNTGALSGGVFVNQGTLVAVNTKSLGVNAVTLNGGTLQLLNNGLGDNGVVSYGNNVTLGSTGVSTISVGNVGAHVGNTVELGNLAFESANAALNVTSANGYTLAFTGSSNISLPGTMVFGGPGNVTLAPTGAGIITGAGGIDKQGTGVLTIGGVGVHNYSGTVAVRGGVLRLDSPSALGSGAGAITLSGGAIEINTTGFSTNRATTISSTTGFSTLRNVQGSNAWVGAITLGEDATLASDAGTLTLGAAAATAIAQGSFSLTLTGAGEGVVLGNMTATGGTTATMTKTGTGRWTLSGTGNRTTAAVTISGGTLQIRNSTALGSNATTSTGTVTISGGAASVLELGNNITVGNATTPGARPMSLSGTLRNVDGVNSWLGNVTLGGTSTISVDAGSLSLTGATGAQFAHGTRALTLTGAGTGTIAGAITGTTGTLTKTGVGAWILQGTNGRTGANTINQGTLEIQNRASLGTGATNLTTAEGNDLTLVASAALGSFVNVGDTDNANVFTFGRNLTLRFDNTAAYAGGAVNGRWADAVAVPLDRGTLQLIGNAAAPSGETVGAVTFDSRSAALIQRLSAGQTTTLTVASLTRTATNRGTLSIFPSVAGQLGADERLVSTAAPAITPGLNAGLDSMAAPFYVNATEHTFVTYGASGFANAAFSANTLESPSTAMDIINTAGIAISGNRNAFALKATGAITGVGNEITIGDAAAGGFISDVAADTTHSANFRFGSTGAGEALIYTSGAGATILSGTITTNNGGLTKFGAGTLELAAANAALTGGVFVNEGTLRLNHIGAIGTNALTVDAATLNVASANTTIGVAIFRNNAVINGAGSLTSAVLTTVQSGSLNVSLSGTGGLTKATTGVFTINSSNAYTGVTAVSAGTLRLTNAAPLTGATGNVTVASGAAIELSGGATISRPLSSLNGTGVGATGGLRSTSGTNAWTGVITLAGTSSLAVDSGTLTLGTAGASAIAANSTMTLTGAGTGIVLGNITATTRSLTKSGVGTWSLQGTGARTTGATNITGGVLDVRNNTALGVNTAAATGAVTVSAGASLELQHATGITVGLSGTPATRPLTLNGDGFGGNGALRNVSGDNTWLGNVTLASNTTIFATSGSLTLGQSSGTFLAGTLDLTLSGAGIGTINAPITATTGNLIKSGAGIWTLTGASTRTTGFVSVEGGTLNLQNSTALGDNATASTFVDAASGTTIELLGDITIGNASDASVRTLSTSGTGVLNVGALRNVSGSNAWLGNISLLGDTTILSDAGNLAIGSNVSTFTIGRSALTLGGASSGVVFGLLHGSDGSLFKTGAGDWTLNAFGSFTGQTTVSDGTLRYGVNNALADGNVLVNGAVAIFDVQSFSDTVGTITLQNGSIIGTSGVLTGTAYNVENGIVSAILAGAAQLTKTTAGTVSLSGNNSYVGLTSVNLGTLLVEANNALGTTAAGTTVADGATLEFATGVNYTSAESITINGTGGGAGAIRNTGTASFAGGIDVATDATLVNSGTFTLTGPVNNNGTTVTFSGVGTYNVSGGVIGAAVNSNLVVDASLFNLSGTNTYNGPTQVQNSGTLRLQSSGALPTAPLTDLTLTGASSTFNLNGFNDTVATLNGNGVVTNSTGTPSTLTISPAAGTATFSGAITGGANMSVIKIGAGTQVLDGISTYTGSTNVNVGLLVLDGSFASSVTIASGATLGGHGSTTGSLAGAGLIAPGNSPGILTAASTDPSGGLDYDFEFTLTAGNSPIYSSAISSGNDVLRLTGGTPFVSSLTGANVVNVHLQGVTLNNGDVFRGGFYTDAGDFLAAISGATFQYFLNSNPISAANFSVSTLLDPFAWGGGPTVNGFVTTFTYNDSLASVPEPGSWLLSALAAAGLGIYRRRRRNVAAPAETATA